MPGRLEVIQDLPPSLRRHRLDDRVRTASERRSPGRGVTSGAPTKTAVRHDSATSSTSVRLPAAPGLLRRFTATLGLQGAPQRNTPASPSETLRAPRISQSEGRHEGPDLRGNHPRAPRWSDPPPPDAGRVRGHGGFRPTLRARTLSSLASPGDADEHQRRSLLQGQGCVFMNHFVLRCLP